MGVAAWVGTQLAEVGMIWAEVDQKIMYFTIWQVMHTKISGDFQKLGAPNVATLLVGHKYSELSETGSEKLDIFLPFLVTIYLPNSLKPVRDHL